MLAHERIHAWKLCHELVLAVYDATTSFPKHELYGLTSQARRAAFSAAVNIVEGSAKRGPAEFRRFLDMCVGSLAELAYTLRVAKDLGFIDDERWRSLEQRRRQAGMMRGDSTRRLRERREEFDTYRRLIYRPLPSYYLPSYYLPSLLTQRPSSQSHSCAHIRGTWRLCGSRG